LTEYLGPRIKGVGLPRRASYGDSTVTRLPATRTRLATREYVAQPMRLRTRFSLRPLLAPAAFTATGLLLGAVFGAALAVATPAPDSGAIFAFEVATGTDWETADFDLSRDDCFALLATSPADSSTRCIRTN